MSIFLKKTSITVYTVLALSIGFYCLDYFYRISPSLVLPQLLKQYDTTPFTMGVFASAFYTGYIIAQIPSGILLDRYSFRWPMAIIILICSMAFLGFVNAHDVQVGIALRFLIGVTSGISFIGVLYIARMYLDNKWLPFISGLAVAIGTLSASFIQTINAYLINYFSWRETMLSFSLWGLVIAILLIVLPIKQKEHNVQFPQTSYKQIFKMMLTLVMTPRFVLNALIAGFFYVPTSILTAVWGIVFLKAAYHLNSEAASTVIFMIFLGWAAGSPIVGYLGSRYVRSARMTVAPAILAAVISEFMLYHSSVVGHAVYVFSFLFGFFSSAQVLVWKTYDQICPPSHTGVGVAVTNMIVMLVVAVMHPLVSSFINMGFVQDKELHTQALLFGLGFVPVCFAITALLGLINIGSKGR